MRVRSIELRHLAHVAPQITALSDRLAYLTGRSVSLRLSPFGDINLTCTNVVEPGPPDVADAVWALSRPGDPRSGYLLLDALTALRLVAGTLGIPAARGIRPLGASERGMVTAVVARALRAAGTDIVVKLGETTWRGAGLVRLVIAAGHDSLGRGSRMDIPSGWLPIADSAAWIAEATRQGLEIPFAMELARTSLTASEWSGARAQDIVVFDDPPLHLDAPSWAGWVTCGRFAAQILVTPNGTIEMISGFQYRGTNDFIQAGNVAETEERKHMAEDPRAQAITLTMLAAAPIEVVAEIGRIMMRADEVTALRPGSVLSFGTLRPTSVRLRVGDRDWAGGELVEVEGRLGVRLTSVIAQPG